MVRIFCLNSIADVSKSELATAFAGADYKLLAGCAPCQPFSTYQQGKSSPTDDRWHLLLEFARLVEESQPELVTMENVPRLAEQDVFFEFIERLEASKFHVSFKTINCADYGVPQQRRRLVLLASKLGAIEMIRPTTPQGKRKTVKQAISKLPEIEAGQQHPKDPLHRAVNLSDLNLMRIRASKPGGSWKDWDESLVAECHKRPTGMTYPSVYGRMGMGRASSDDDDTILRFRKRQVWSSRSKSGYFT